MNREDVKKLNCFWDRRTSDIYSQIEISPGEELSMYYIKSERDFLNESTNS